MNLLSNLKPFSSQIMYNCNIYTTFYLYLLANYYIMQIIARFYYLLYKKYVYDILLKNILFKRE